MFLTGLGNFGLGTNEPKAKIHVNGGNIFIENPNNGIIMTAPNGQCWQVNINNAGNFSSSAITCPN